MDSECPNPLWMSTHIESIKNIRQRPHRCRIIIIIIKHVNVDNHKNNTSHHEKPSSEAWICLMDTNRPQIIAIHHHRPKLISDPVVDLVWMNARIHSFVEGKTWIPGVFVLSQNKMCKLTKLLETFKKYENCETTIVPYRNLQQNTNKAGKN